MALFDKTNRHGHVISPAADVKYRRAGKIKTKRLNATEPANSARGFFSGPSGFSRHYAPAFVRFWTTADKVGFGPGRFCSLMTQSGHERHAMVCNTGR